MKRHYRVTAGRGRGESLCGRDLDASHLTTKVFEVDCSQCLFQDMTIILADMIQVGDPGLMKRILSAAGAKRRVMQAEWDAKTEEEKEAIWQKNREERQARWDKREALRDAHAKAWKAEHPDWEAQQEAWREKQRRQNGLVVHPWP